MITILNAKKGYATTIIVDAYLKLSSKIKLLAEETLQILTNFTKVSITLCSTSM